MMGGLEQTIEIANRGFSDTLNHGIALTVAMLMLFVSIAFNAFLLRLFVQMKDVMGGVKEALAELNVRIGKHD